MKKLSLVLTLGAAALFAACGDDESDEFSCTYQEYDYKVCEQGPSVDGIEEYCKDLNGKSGSSCESGADLTCDMDGISVKFYGDMSGITCELFGVY